MPNGKCSAAGVTANLAFHAAGAEYEIDTPPISTQTGTASNMIDDELGLPIERSTRR